MCNCTSENLELISGFRVCAKQGAARNNGGYDCDQAAPGRDRMPQAMLRTMPPSTRSAAPLVADACFELT